MDENADDGGGVCKRIEIDWKKDKKWSKDRLNRTIESERVGRERVRA
jgi:hypothetical protein